MYPVLLKIGSLNFYSHGVLIVLGITFGITTVYFLAKRRELGTNFLFDSIVYTVLLGIVGARISYFILYPNQFTSLSQIIFIWEGGLVSYGGFVLGGLTFLTFLKFQKQPILEWFDVMAAGFPLGLFLGRLGDVLAGDYSGSYSFTNLSSFKNGLPLPLYEAILCILIFLLILIIFLKNKKTPGFIFFLMTLLYSGGRFIIDFWRSEVSVLLGISIGQVFSLIIFLVSLVAIILLLRVQKEGEHYGITS